MSELAPTVLVSERPALSSGRSDPVGSVRRWFVAAACLTSLLSALAAVQQAGAATLSSARAARLVAVTPAAVLPRGAVDQGALAASTRVSGVVALRLRDGAGAAKFINQISDPRSPLYHHYLAPGQFSQLFGARPATIAAVRHRLSADGLDVTGVSRNGLLISFSATASDAERAFHTGLDRVRLADGRLGQATSSTVSLPASIAGDVQAVIGLDELVHETSGALLATPKHHATPGAAAPVSAAGGPVACQAALAQQATGGLTVQQIANSYGVGGLYQAGDVGVGQTVDIYELEPFLTSDIRAFDLCFFGAHHGVHLSVTNVDGGPGTGPGSAEAALDIESVAGIAPGAHIHVFSGPNMDQPFGPLDTWNAIAVADDARQVSSSWGVCETAEQVGQPGVQQVENEIFQQMAAQGQSVFASAGDDGSDDCAGHAISAVASNLSLDDPASQPDVVSVGGTTILDASDPPSEMVWNNGNFGGAGGGGISETWAMPSWQTGFAVPENAGNEACSNDPSGTADDSHLADDPTNLPAGTLCRQTPDVSALADPQTGLIFYFAGSWSQVGGTSLATPLWAAMLAEVNASAACASAPHGVGFVSPLLYQVAGSGSANYASAFNDITVGNNDNLGVGAALDYPAGPGYDLASGLGTPRMTNTNGRPGLAMQLCDAVNAAGAPAEPSVTGLNPLTGSATPAAGTRITISGSNFGTAAGSVYFGDVTATVTQWTPTAVTVDLPAYHAPPGTAPGAAGSADITVVTAASPMRSSAPGPSSVFHYAAGSTGTTPVIDYVSSSAGPIAGGNNVTLVGAGFTGATGVTFGGVPAGSIHVLSDNELTVTVPPQGSTTSCANHTPGICQVPVVVTNSSGSSSGPAILRAYTGPIVFQPSGVFMPPPDCRCEIAPAPEEYDYAEPPTITSVQPAASEAGGTRVAISGKGFNLLDFQWINVGPAGPQSSEQFNLASVSPTEIDFVAPPIGPPFTTEPVSVPLSVQTSGGLSRTAALEYAGVPTLSSISSHVGAIQSPGTLTITGKGLSDATSVEFVGQGFLNFLSSTTTRFVGSPTDTSLTVDVPQFFAYPTDVLVCSATGCSAPNPNVDTFVFAYAGRPSLSASSPKGGPARGGTVVTLEGTLDSEVTRVDFGTVAGTIEQQPGLTPSGPIVVLAPPGTAGTKVYITITTVGGRLINPPEPTSARTNDATFTYAPSVSTAPTGVAAMPGTGSATVSWTAPANDGGDPITGYTIVANSKAQNPADESTAAGVTHVSFPTLKPHVGWVFTVRATTTRGPGAPARSALVKPG